jgi:hypothetical protein
MKPISGAISTRGLERPGSRGVPADASESISLDSLGPARPIGRVRERASIIRLIS